MTGPASVCPTCQGHRTDPDDEGDYDQAVHMHNPYTRGPCPTCNGTGLHEGNTMTTLLTMSDVLRSDTDLNDIEDANERWLLARLRLTEQRRAQDARHTWSPFDQNVPDEAVVKIADLDGDVWNLVGTTSAGPWRMRDFDPEQHETRAGQDLGWQELVYEYAPLTDANAPAEASR